MLTKARTISLRAAAVGLVAGLVSFSASAMEEVIVYGTDAAALEDRAELKAELKEYLESLNRQLKERLDAEMAARPAASVKLALAEITSRG